MIIRLIRVLSLSALLRFVPALIQAQGVREGGGAVLVSHGVAVEITRALGTTGVGARAGGARSGGGRWFDFPRSRRQGFIRIDARRRGRIRKSAGFYGVGKFFCKERLDRCHGGVCFTRRGIPIDPDIERGVHDDYYNDRRHFARVGLDKLADGL